MTRYAYLAIIMAFTLGACGQEDGQTGGEQAAAEDTSKEYFEAAAKVGEVRDTGLGYDYVVVDHGK